MTDYKKYLDPKQLRRALSFNRIQFVNDEIFRKSINDTFQDIVDFINQEKILNLPEVGFYIDNPQDGILVFASGWTQIWSPVNGLTRNSGFNPNFPSNHTEKGGNLSEGKGLYFRINDKWNKITLTTGLY